MPPLPRDSMNYATLYDDHAQLNPGSPAIIDNTTDTVLNYKELTERIAAAGNALAEIGVKKGDRVAIFGPNRIDFISTVFGGIRIGAVPVPVNIELPNQTLKFVVEDCGATHLITFGDSPVIQDALKISETAKNIENVAVSRASISEFSTDVVTTSFSVAMDKAQKTLSPERMEPDAPALQPYTSGSTGNPKGIILSHHGLAWNTETIKKVHFFSDQDRALVAGPLYHKNAMIGAIKPFLAAGGSIVLMRSFDAKRMIQAIEEYEVTYLRGVPAMFKLLLDETEALQSHDVSTIDWAISGGANLPISLAEEFRDAFDAPLGEAYGLTEGGPVITLPCRWGPRVAGSSGHSLPGVETKIIDPETGKEVEPGTVGELIVTNPGIGEYHNRPGATAEAFETRDGDVYLHTKDVAREDEQGFHYIVGRLDDMIIVGGENVYPAEVENLLQTHPAVTDAAVIGVSHEVKGEAPVAFVVTDEETSEDAIRQYCIDHGPAYAHPRRVFFRSELPLVGTGKVDKESLSAEANQRISGGL